MLNEERRKQLDTIVQDMLHNEEDDFNIRFVVDDFKKKYDVPEVQPVEEQKGGMLNAIGKTIGQVGIGAAKEAGKTALGLAKIGGKVVDVLSPGQPFAERLGDEADIQRILETQGTAQKIGGGIEKVAEFMAPGQVVRGAKTAISGIVGATKLAPALQRVTKILAGAGLEGLSAGFVKTLQTGGDLGEAGKTALIAGAIATPFEALRVLSAPIAGVLQKSAEKKVSQALAPTTLENKRLANKVVPEMLSRRVKFLTKGGLEAQAEEGMGVAGQNLEDAYSALPENTKVAIAPIVEKLGKIKDSLVVAGTKTIPEAAQSEYQALHNIQQELVDVAAGRSKVGIESLRNYRQILDATIKKAGQGFGFTGKEKAAQVATKSMANAIRGELAKEFPEIAKINAEFNFWSNVKDVVSATILRTKGQGEPLGRQILEGAGFAGGLAAGGFGNAFSGLIAMHYLKQAVTSAAWRNVSGIVRQNISDALAGGNMDKAIEILGRLAISSEETIRAENAQSR